MRGECAPVPCQTAALFLFIAGGGTAAWPCLSGARERGIIGSAPPEILFDYCSVIFCLSSRAKLCNVCREQQ